MASNSDDRNGTGDDRDQDTAPDSETTLSSDAYLESGLLDAQGQSLGKAHDYHLEQDMGTSSEPINANLHPGYRETSASSLYETKSADPFEDDVELNDLEWRQGDDIDLSPSIDASVPLQSGLAPASEPDDMPTGTRTFEQGADAPVEISTHERPEPLLPKDDSIADFAEDEGTQRASSASPSHSVAPAEEEDGPEAETDIASDIRPIRDADETDDAVDENSAFGTEVGIHATAAVSDGEAVTYRLSDDAGGLFAIDPATGVVTVAGDLDAESAGRHEIVVVATASDGATQTETFTIAIRDVDEYDVTTPAPVGAVPASLSEDAAGGDPLGLTVTSEDRDITDSVSYSVDDDRFSIDENGIVSLSEDAGFDAETESIVSLTVTATSTDGSQSSQVFTLNITDVNEADISAVTDTDSSANKIAEDAGEGAATGISAFATDSDASDTVTYSVDDDRFQVAEDGTVTIASGASFDAETEASVSLTVTATSTDGSTSSETFDIAVADVNETAISALTDADASANSVAEDAAEGTSVGITALATDADATDTVSYSVDDGRFQVAEDGTITVAAGATFDHESEAAIALTVTATSTDGSTSSETYDITVSDVDETPVSAVTDTDSSSNTIAEDASEGAATGISAFATDSDASDTVTYSVDDDRFQVAEDGTVTIASGASFNAETEASVSLTVTATSTDGSTSSETFDITVADVNETAVSALTDADGSANSVAEDAAEGTSVGITALATDADATDTVSYSVDDDRFQVAEDGTITVAAGAAFDHETEASIALTVTATSTDGSTNSESFSVDVANVIDEAPTDITYTGGTVNETVSSGGSIASAYDAAGATVAVLSTTDADGPDDAFTYEITSDPSGHYEIVGNEVRVKAGRVIDHESETSHEITVEVADAAGNTFSKALTIDVENFAGAATGDELSTTITGSSEEDTITGGSGDDTISGGDGNDTLYGEAAPETGTWHFRVYDHDFSSAAGQTGDIENGGLIDEGVTDAFDLQTVIQEARGSTENAEDYGVILASNFTSGEGGTYRFSTRSDDGSTLQLIDSNGNPVTFTDPAGNLKDNLDNDYHQSATTRWAEADLEPGEIYTIEIRYWENRGVEVLEATVTPPGGSAEDLFTSGYISTAAQVPGNDTLMGGAGDDTIDGGLGTDTAVFSGNLADYDITEDGGVFTVTDTRPDSPDGTDTVVNVQTFRFADGDVASGDLFAADISALVDADASGNTIAENAAPGSTVGITAFASDANTSDDVSYSVSDDRFTVTEDGTIQVASGAEFDHETESEISVTVAATSSDGSTSEETFTISVENVIDETPTDIIFNGNTVSETVSSGGNIASAYDPSGSTVAVLATTDADDADDSFTYAITSDPSGHFEIVGNEVRVKSGQTIDFETAESHTITVQVTDAAGHTYSEMLTINVEDFEGTASGDGSGAGLYGTSEEDTITGSDASEAIRGNDGADQLSGGGGNDKLYIDADDTLVEGGDGHDSVYVDSAEGVSLDLAAAEVEEAVGNDGNDVFDASGSTVRISLKGEGGDDTLIGGDQADTMYGGDGADRLSGGDGADRLFGGDGADQLSGGGGNDKLYIDADDTLVEGGDGHDSVYVDSAEGVSLDLAAAEVEEAVGNDGNDVFDASGSTVRISLKGEGGDDTLIGGDQADTMYGGDGADRLSGGDGADRLFGGDGADQLSGGGGNDKLYVDADDTLVEGGDGYDTVYVDSAEGVSLDLAAAEVEEAVGNDGNDVFDASGSTVRISLKGEGGDDTLIGGDQADTMYGGDGDDILTGNGGNDSLYGGDGTDVAVFSGNRSDYTISQISDDTYSIIDDRTGSPDGTVKVYNVETLRFGDGDIPAGPDLIDKDIGAVSDANTESNSIYENAVEGTSVGITATATDDNAFDSVTYSVSDDRFAVADDGTVSVATGASFDTETESSIDLTVTATSTDGSTSQETFTISVADVNETAVSAVSDSDTSTNTVAEDAVEGTTIGVTVLATDADATDSVTYSVSDDRFAVADDGTVSVAANAGFDYETEPAISFTVTATSTDGSTSQETFTVSVSDVAEAYEWDPSSNSFTDTGVAEAKITGSDGADTIVGHDDGANIDSGAGADTVYGGAGNDEIVFGTGADTVYGGAGNDHIDDARSAQISQEANLLDGGAGNDTIYGGGGDDTLLGGDGNDRLSGEGDNDTMEGGAGNDQLYGSTGSDVAVYSGDRDDYTITRNSNGSFRVVDSRPGSPDGTDTVEDVETFRFADGDVLSGDLIAVDVSQVTDTDDADNAVAENAAAGSSTGIAAFAEDTNTSDSVSYSVNDARFEIADDGTVTVASGASFDYETESEIALTVTATSTDGSVDEETFTIAVADIAENIQLSDQGASFTDTGVAELSVTGGAGNDQITAQDDGGTLYGGGGNDIIRGGAGNDNLYGGEGDDTIYSGAGVDTADGGEGSDTIVLSQSDGGQSNTITDTGTSGTDTLELGTGAGTYRIQGDFSSSSGIEIIDGSGTTGDQLGTKDFAANFDFSNVALTGVDEIIGTGNDDTIVGSASGDTISLGAGDDTVTGGAGDDMLDGGEGTDTVTFAGNWRDYAIGLNDDGSYTVSDSRTDGPDGTDTVSNIENFRFSDGDVAAADLLAPPVGPVSDTNDAANTIHETDCAGTQVGITAFANEPDSDAVSYTLSDDRFEIDSDGVVTVASHAFFDSQSEDSIDLVVTANSADGSQSTESFSVSVTGDYDRDHVGDSGDETFSSSGMSFSVDGVGGSDVLQTGNYNDRIEGGSSAGNDSIHGNGGNDLLFGQGGDDVITGGAGDDIIIGGAGDDNLAGGEGSDLFMHGLGDGNDTISGGAGASWTDVIDLGGGPGVVSAGSYGTDWTVTVTNGAIETTNTESGRLELSDDASGTIDFVDGSSVSFSDIEEIRW